jgi:transposase
MEAYPRRTFAAKKNLAEHVQEQSDFLDHELTHRLEEAKSGTRRVYFVDASHFVYGTFLCCLWSLTRLWIPAASGRQRFNVLGAYDPILHKLISVRNTTTVNAETMCELVQLVRQENQHDPDKPITFVLDNARYQRNAWVQEMAGELGIELLFLPSYSPNLNLIERYWRLLKKQALYGKYHRNFAAFRAAIELSMIELHDTKRDKLETMMTLNFQTFEKVSLMAA